MRIVVINDFLAAGSGGAGVAVLRTFRALAGRVGVDSVTVIGFRSDLLNDADQATPPRFRVELWPGMHLSWWKNNDGMVLLSNRMIEQRLRELMPDVLVAASPTIACAQALRFARRHSIPSVYLSQTQAETLQPYVPRWLGASLAPALTRSFTRLVYPAFARVDAVVFPTPTARDLITRAGPEFFRKVTSVVISNGVDTSSYRPSRAKARDLGVAAPNFLFVGRLMRDKSPEMPVRALARVRSRGVPATLTIVGRGPLEGSLMRLAADLGIEEQVRFTGFLPEELVIRHLQEATATIIPSFAETQSLVLLESLACGTPVLCADAPTNAASPFIRSHGCGDLYKFDDPDSLAEALIRLARDRKRYRVLCGNCLGVRDRFSLESITTQWLDLCHALRAEKCRADSDAAGLWPAGARRQRKGYDRKGAMGT